MEEVQDQLKGTPGSGAVKMMDSIPAVELGADEKRKLLEKIRSRKGSAPIKEQFINFQKFSQLYNDSSKNAAASKARDPDDGQPPTKRQKKTGQNKSRPKPVRLLTNEKLCLYMAKDKVCPYDTRCKFNHDIAGMMKKKPSDIGPKCYNFDSFGHCPFGLMCRYGTSHISSDLKNITDEARKIDQSTMTSNRLSMELKRELRKKKIKYPRSDEYLTTLPREGKGKKKAMKENAAPSSRPTIKINDSMESKVASATVKPVDEPIPSGGSAAGERLNGLQGEMPHSVDGRDNILTGVNQENISSNLEKSSLNKTTSAEIDLSGSSEQQGESVAQRGRNAPDLYARENIDSVEESAQIQVKDKSEFIDRGSKESTDLNLSHENKEPSGIVLKATPPGELNPVMDVSTSSPSGHDATGRGTTVASDMDTVTSSSVVKSEINVTMATDDGDCMTGLSLREKKQLDVKGKLLLAPLTTVGNLPFRRVCKRFGADITCGEMAMCTNLLMGQACEWALLRRHHTEDVFGVQLCGAFPDTMTKCAELLTTQLNIDFIDVNVGCPIDLVYHKGAGSGLMNRMSKFEQIVRGMSSVMDVPLTVKMRTGVLQNKNIAHSIIPKLYDWGASVVTVHGRSREARYTRTADWEYLKTCAEIGSPHPFVGNGDILSFEDANDHFAHSGSAGIMIARGALVKPWIFTEIKEQRHWDISSNERLDILRDFTNYGLEHWGCDTQGVNKTRRFLLEWLSFLHRYIPVDLLEQLPQSINQRPPFYIGRNDLETLMASSKCDDWIKISEMLLGPVPDDFLFLPKHKANSYN